MNTFDSMISNISYLFRCITSSCEWFEFYVKDACSLTMLQVVALSLMALDKFKFNVFGFKGLVRGIVASILYIGKLQWFP